MLAFRVPTTEVPKGAPEVSDAEILAAVDRGDPRGALALLMRAYGAAVYRFCARQLRDSELAAEIQQQCFLEAFKDLARFSRRSTIRTWIIGIAHHRCLDAIKMRRRFRARFTLQPEPPDAPAPADTADETLIRLSRERHVLDCLQTLAPAVRGAVNLRYVEGLTYVEMAEIENEKPATLQARVARAMPHLRTCLERRGER